MCQTFIVESPLPETKMALLLVLHIARLLTNFVCPRNERISLPVSTCHHLIILSFPDENIDYPSLLIMTLNTDSLWPIIVFNRL